MWPQSIIDGNVSAHYYLSLLVQDHLSYHASNKEKGGFVAPHRLRIFLCIEDRNNHDSRPEFLINVPSGNSVKDSWCGPVLESKSPCWMWGQIYRACIITDCDGVEIPAWSPQMSMRNTHFSHFTYYWKSFFLFRMSFNTSILGFSWEILGVNAILKMW